MVTIQEFEIYFNAKLMASHLNQSKGMNQWRLLQKVEAVVNDTIKELDLEDKIHTVISGSTIHMRMDVDYLKDELHIEEDISQKMIWSWYNYHICQIKVTKKKEKVKNDFTGLFLFNKAIVIAEDKTKTFDEQSLTIAQAIKEKEDEAEKLRHEELEQDKEKWITFYTKTLKDNGISKEKFEKLYNEYYSLPWLPSDVRDEVFQVIEKETD